MIFITYVYCLFFLITLVALAPYIKSIGWFYYFGVLLLCPVLDLGMIVLSIPSIYYNNLRTWGRRMEAKAVLSDYKKSQVFSGLKIVREEPNEKT